jgi:hypothetical protein
VLDVLLSGAMHTCLPVAAILATQTDVTKPYQPLLLTGAILRALRTG